MERFSCDISELKTEIMAGLLTSMAKAINLPQNDGQELDTELRSKACDELTAKFSTPGNCQHLEVARVNPEIFKSVK